MPAQGAIRVEGLRELQRAFARADKTARDDLKDALQEAAAPVRSDAQAKASVEISRMKTGSPWTRMRIGMSGATVVWVAPVERGARGRSTARRPKFAGLMTDRALQPALDANRRKVEDRLDHMLDEVVRVWERP